MICQSLYCFRSCGLGSGAVWAPHFCPPLIDTRKPEENAAKEREGSKAGAATPAGEL
jgi:hypothetical protein